MPNYSDCNFIITPVFLSGSAESKKSAKSIKKDLADVLFSQNSLIFTAWVLPEYVSETERTNTTGIQCLDQKCSKMAERW